MTVFAMAGKMPPRPSSPFSRGLIKLTAALIARSLAERGNIGSTLRSTLSMLRNISPQAEPVGLTKYFFTSFASSTNSSAILIFFGFSACGFSVIKTRSGTKTVRDQYETLPRWNGNQLGSKVISTGITGTARHGTCPKSAKVIRVKTFALAAPPFSKMAARALTICGASGESPASLSAKYAFTLALILKSPS